MRPHLVALLALILGAGHAQRVLCPEPVELGANEALQELCQSLPKACVDQGDTFVLYSNQHNPRHPAFKGLPKIGPGDAHVDYFGFGDVWGTEFQYPSPLVRPATAGEETKELQEPQFSRWCAPRAAAAALLLSKHPPAMAHRCTCCPARMACSLTCMRNGPAGGCYAARCRHRPIPCLPLSRGPFPCPCIPSSPHTAALSPL
jgi:hypothetical protein